MGAMPNEPSMEEILSSIKRIIAEEDTLSAAPRIPRRAPAPAATNAAPSGEAVADDQILELTDALPGETDAAGTQEKPAPSAPAKPESKVAAPVSDQKTPKAEPAAPEAARTESKAAPRARAATAPAPDTHSPAVPASDASEPAPAVMSDDSARAARDSLVNLSKLLVNPDDGQTNTLEGLVREMLRPMLKDWLDAHLPHIVEAMVKREIDRITGRV